MASLAAAAELSPWSSCAAAGYSGRSRPQRSRGRRRRRAIHAAWPSRRRRCSAAVCCMCLRPVPDVVVDPMDGVPAQEAQVQVFLGTCWRRLNLRFHVEKSFVKGEPAYPYCFLVMFLFRCRLADENELCVQLKLCSLLTQQWVR